jgi:hypothetical protein
MELETIDKLYLELSQFTTAITKRELDLMKRINELQKELDENRTTHSMNLAEKLRKSQERIKVLEYELEDKEKTVELHRKRADAYRNEALGSKFDTLADVIKESITEGKYSQNNKVKQLTERIKVLEDALNKIANPIIYLQSKAEKEGSKLDGLMAIEFSNSAICLKEIARAALEVKP